MQVGYPHDSQGKNKFLRGFAARNDKTQAKVLAES
jgi:hypothetical protein